MPNVKFLLKDPKSNNKTLVYMIFRFNNQRFKYSFDEKINPKFWNFEKQRVKETKQFVEYPEFNARLNNYETSINNVYRKLLNDGKNITTNILKNELNKELSNINYNKKYDLFSFIEDFISKSNKKYNTIKHYKQTLRQLSEFKKHINRNINFDDINLDFYNEFVRFLNERNYQENTIGGYIKNIKVFMNEATERNLNTNLDFKKRSFKTLDVETENIYLSIDEIKKIYELDLSKDDKINKVKEIFILACYTGLRFSDLKQLSINNFIKNNTQIKIKTEKTGEIVIIPVHPYIKEIMKKNNNELPVLISNQKMNEYLKYLGKLAGLKEKILISKIIGGKQISETYNKYELITVHTARRSFATNSYLMNVPTISIMKITGHRTERAFLKYIKITQEDNANKLINHPFFK